MGHNGTLEEKRWETLKSIRELRHDDARGLSGPATEKGTFQKILIENPTRTGFHVIPDIVGSARTRLEKIKSCYRIGLR